ncbi:uncharacterized protein EV420DRAFT_1638435 [Desarmillaria tabescens]|uniref:Arrestin C-terminal-like domain-containing protein n=1 Tax=Armillaria tabescens TaxID=1929756 RepID=A0AA39TU15_ARMTA|nr:uncharacterized protein EV420DRAFT_1638435 [Desarmillaria tabescens]KAK0463499.1 hypothetical protein EV420DRAFT_1638435 [Desarmillaria tabescens]
MSQVKLTLRQPPNVEFVHGYPGIPSGGTDRPQAAVKGAIEVRVGPQGVKAKWLRVELRKVEQIPMTGENTFFDYVGPSPVNVWTAPEEWEVLKSSDFPFDIRIPESIPPTLTLEGRVGIKYELIASVCTKGKRGFLRKRKSNVVSTQNEIVIDKHDLHSTWPVYCQTDVRRVELDGVSLTVERHQTCYGPGDRVAVFATVRSDNLQTVILRGFELSIRESRTFRAGAFTGGRKTTPVTRVGNILENKFAVNMTLMGGMQHKAELSSTVSPSHTTTTLNSARHIDINYVLCVKAIMGTGHPLVMDLPVIMSNWPRNVSQEAIRRIGPAPGLSLLAPHSVVTSVEPSPAARHQPIQSQSYSGRPSQPDTVAVKSPVASTFASPAQPRTNGHANVKTDEFGYGVGYGHKSTPSKSNSIEGEQKERETGARRPSSSGTSVSARLTITNALPSEIPEAPRTNGRTRSGSGRAWPTAEDEKQMYHRAKARVEQVQGSVARTPSPTPTTSRLSPPPIAHPQPRSAVKHGQWPTAEEEKFLAAQAAVQRTQGIEIIVPASDATRPTRNPSISKSLPNGAGSTTSPREKKSASGSKVIQYPSAADEKAALKRYNEAKQAVDRTQNVGLLNGVGPGPVAYDSLYPSSSKHSPPTHDEPPPFEAAAGSSSSGFESALQEKARMRRAMEASQSHSPPPPSIDEAPAYGSPPPFASGAPSAAAALYASGLSEKEILRRKFEAQDAEAMASGSGSGRPPVTPPRSMSSMTRRSSSRPTPTPPSSSSRVMTAAEEKAMLKAKYATEDQVNGSNGSIASSSSSSAPAPAPPPLMPRPPAEYIQETQEEDARVSKMVHEDGALALDDDDDALPLPNGNGSAAEPLKPFFANVPPPPLPPKPLSPPPS